MGADDRRGFDGLMRGHGADAHEAVVLGDVGKAGHAAEVDHFGRGGKAQLHHGNEAHAPGQQFSFAAIEERQSLG